MTRALWLQGDFASSLVANILLLLMHLACKSAGSFLFGLVVNCAWQNKAATIDTLTLFDAQVLVDRHDGSGSELTHQICMPVVDIVGRWFHCCC